MDTILINPAEIESCWEKEDACFVKTKTGKVWICDNKICIDIKNDYFIWTIDFILENMNKQMIKLPLKRSAGYEK